MEPEPMARHGLEAFYLVVFACLFIISGLMRRMGRYMGCIAASAMFFAASIKMKTPWATAVSFGDGPFFFTFDQAPIYLFCALPVVVFVADVIARETFRAPIFLSGFIAGIFNVVISFPLALFAACSSHILVDDDVVVDIAKQFALALAALQFFVTESLQFVDIIFCKTKRFAFLQSLVSQSAAVGSVVLLAFLYQKRVISVTVLPWFEDAITPATLSDLIPVAVATFVMFLGLVGLCAGVARYPSVIGTLLFTLVCGNLSILIFFLPRMQSSVGSRLPLAFATTTLGKAIVFTVCICGFLVTLLPLFNNSPISESPRAYLDYINRMKEEEEKKKGAKKEQSAKKPKEDPVAEAAKPEPVEEAPVKKGKGKANKKK